MDGILKKRILWALGLQACVWVAGLVTMLLLSFVLGPSDFLDLIGFGMFLTPLVAIFFFVPLIHGFFKKMGYVLLYLFLIWGLNFCALYVINLSGWESRTDRNLKEVAKGESEKEENIYREIQARVEKIKTLNEATVYLQKYLIEKKKSGNGNNDTALEDKKASLLWLLNQRGETFGDEATAKMALLLLQYAGGTTEETVEAYEDILWKNTPAALQAMVDAKKEFFPELRNKEFYEYLYGMVLCVPYDNTGLSEQERTLKAKPYKDLLGRLRNGENSDFVDYLIADHRMENWIN